MNDKNYDFRNDTGTWQTGRTQPPKRYGGLIAFLIGLVILLSGISTALSIMNIKLYRKLSDVQSSAPMTFSRSADAALQPTEAADHEEIRELQIHLGISGTLIPPVYQRYYKLPSGIYVSRVADNSDAQINGMVAGDIITAIDGEPVGQDLPEGWFHELQTGDTVTLTVYRSGTLMEMSLAWAEAQ